jgi:hypothetical protein
MALSNGSKYLTDPSGIPVEDSNGSTRILAEWVDGQVYTYETVADMVADEGLTVGAKVRTLGYWSTGDGGGNDYEIVAAGTGTDDGGSFIDLSGSGLQAKGLLGGSISVKVYGAVGDGVVDDTLAIQNAMSSSYKSIHIPDGDFLVTEKAISSTQGRVITCDGWLTTNVSPLTFLEVRGDDSYIQINVDGASLGTRGVAGWVCTASGTPGTWKAMATLST